MPYEWYYIINENSDELEQGDFIPKCSVVIPPEQHQLDENVEVTIEEIDAIVLSQSCDLVNTKINTVLLCPYYSLETFVDGLPDHEKSKKGVRRAIDNLRKGYLTGYHLLNKCPQAELMPDYQVVDFHNFYGINISSLQLTAKSKNPRARLLPPYREHLSQAFARFVMRVGLPQDIIVEDKDIDKYTSK